MTRIPDNENEIEIFDLQLKMLMGDEQYKRFHQRFNQNSSQIVDYSHHLVRIKNLRKMYKELKI